jgi:hypothetical protein
MSFDDEFGEITFEGDAFSPAAIVCDTRDGELAIVVEQQGEELRVRWYSAPLEVHTGKTLDFALVETGKLACVGFVVDTADDDQAHQAKAYAQLGALAKILPGEFREFLRATTND